VGDIIDTGSVSRDIGAGQPLYLVITVATAITSGGSAKVIFHLVSDATTTIATNGAATEHVKTNDIAVADLVAGYTLVIPLPSSNPTYERYLGFQVEESASQALTGGTVNAYLTLDPQGPRDAYADASN